MANIWKSDGKDWVLLPPEDYGQEAQLHKLVEEAPHLLPLSGNPTIVVVGSEVMLGAGRADLLGVDVTGQPVIIEVKLERNAEARRAVVAQVLSYAAYLFGKDAQTFEREILGLHLRQRQISSLAAAAADAYQEGDLDQGAFRQSLEACLAEGRFRLVVVLDSAPDELIRIARFLEAAGSHLTIDLITVRAYRVEGSTILVPQRIDPGRPLEDSNGTKAHRVATSQGELVDGSEDFEAAITLANPIEQQRLQRVLAWAKRLEAEGLAYLETFNGVNRKTLLPRLHRGGVGLVTVWNENGAYLQLWKTVIERRAPNSLASVVAALGKTELKQGGVTREVSDELLNALVDAYREAATT